VDAKRVAEIFVRASGAWRRASGYAIDATRVVTAKHALVGADEVRVRFLRDSELRPAKLRVQSRDRDVAVVELLSPCDFLREPVGRYAGSNPVDWTAVGFPRASETTELNETFRDSLQLEGRYLPLGSAKRGLLQLTVDPPPARPELWHGLSGAGVFVHDRLVAIVVTVPSHFNGATLQGEPLAAVAEELGLGDVSEIVLTRQVPLPQREVAPLSRDGNRESDLRGVPPFPVNFVPREAELTPLKRNLLEQAVAQHVITTSRHGLHAQGGIGKTVLATALAHDPEVRQAFPDGIYWVTLGQEPNLLALQETLLVLANEKRSIESVNLGTVALRDVFGKKRCLFILDDVWQAPHLSAFDALGPRGRFLITTRDREIVTQFGATSVDLGVFTPAAAYELLARWAETPTEGLPAAACQVARECGYLPLALAITGAQVKDGTSWNDVFEALRQGDVEFLDHANQSVFKSLSASMRALSDADCARYLDLAIFPEDVAVPARVVVRLWERVGLKGYKARHLLQRFASRSLLTLSGDGDDSVVTLHDLQGDYLRSAATDPRAIHERLLSAYREDLPPAERESRRWAELSRSESYVWSHLFHHMLGAGHMGPVEELVTDARWLTAKALTSGVSALLTELRDLSERAPSADIQCIERVVRNEAGWLHLDPNALSGLLYNRLHSEGRDPNEVERLLGTARPPMRLVHAVLFGEGHVFRGHTDAVLACAYSPDGSRILSISRDNTLREWDCETGRQLGCFENRDGVATTCAYSPDGSRIVSTSNGDTLREWDRATGQELTRFEGHKSLVISCAYSPDGSRILSASWDHTLREWDCATGLELTRFEGHSADVIACAYSLDGSRILSASDDNTVREWDRATGRELIRLQHERHVIACAYSLDGSRILSAGHNTLHEWDRASGQELGRRTKTFQYATASTYSPDRNRILTTSHDKTVREWDRSTGKELGRFEGDAAACAYSPDGNRILSACNDNTLREWHRAPEQSPGRREGHSDQVTACAYSPDAMRILTASKDDTMREWNRSTKQELLRIDHSGTVTSCAYRPDGSRVLSGSWDNILREWNLAARALPRFEETATAQVYSADGNPTGEELTRFQGHGGSITACAYSPDGSRVLSASEDKTLREWDHATGQQLMLLEGHSDIVTCCAYSPDGSRILSASWDDTLREWDRITGRELIRFNNAEPVRVCAYSPDGSRILYGSWDYTLREWDRAAGQATTRWEGHSGEVTACAFSPDGSRILSASTDSTVKIWSSATGECLDTLYGIAPMHCLAVTHGQFVAGDDLGNLWIVDCDWLG